MQRSHIEDGFTLTEILVGLFIFALASSMAVVLLASTVEGETANKTALDQIQSLDRLRSLLRDDFGQTIDRPVRDADGYHRPYVFAGSQSGIPQGRSSRQNDERLLISLTRRGRANPGLTRARSSLMHVEYWFRDGDLIRRLSEYPDMSDESTVQDQILLSGLSALELEFFQEGFWNEQTLLSNGESENALPAAVRFRYELPGLGPLEHLVLIGVTVP